MPAISRIAGCQCQEERPGLAWLGEVNHACVSLTWLASSTTPYHRTTTTITPPLLLLRSLAFVICAQARASRWTKEDIFFVRGRGRHRSPEQLPE